MSKTTTRATDSAYPVPCTDAYVTPEVEGLTKREYFAAMALQGSFALYGNHPLPLASKMATDAVAYADALIDALNKTN